MSEGAGDEGLKHEEAPQENGQSAQLCELRRQVEGLQAALDKQTAQTKEYLDAARRITADFDNYRKRSAKDREEIIRSANDKLVAELLTVYDDLERAMASNATPEEFRNGVNQIHLNLGALLRSYGLKEIPSKGRFDPELHEALSVGEGDDGMILEVYQKGYCLGPRILRHAKVKVGVRPENEKEE